MNAKQRIVEAAFWGEWVCLGCGKGEDDPRAPLGCKECGGGMVGAASLLHLIEKLEREREKEGVEG